MANRCGSSSQRSSYWNTLLCRWPWRVKPSVPTGRAGLHRHRLHSAPDAAVSVFLRMRGA